MFCGKKMYTNEVDQKYIQEKMDPKADCDSWVRSLDI